MKKVLVTGASSGIGRSITEYLSVQNYTIFAGARKEDDISSLNSLKNVTGVLLDVTNQNHIDNVIEKILSMGDLDVLINNAGVGVAGAIIELDIDDLQHQMNVNLFGSIRMIKACFPLLKVSKGQIINVSSLNGHIVSPFGSPYVMSKFAMEGMTEALQIELKKFGIKVSTLNPGYFKTDIITKMKDQAQILIDKSNNYKEEFMYIQDQYEKMPNARDPMIIAKLTQNILEASKPHSRYLIASKDEQKWTYNAILTRLIELNLSTEEPWSTELLKEYLEKIQLKLKSS